MAFNNGMTSVKNNIRLKSIYRRPKLLGNSGMSMDPTPNYNHAKFELSNHIDERATLNRVKKYIIISGIIITALIATVYVMSQYM